MRKGQVTVFATLGLVILIIVGLVLFVLTDIYEDEPTFEKPNEMTFFIKTCADNLLDEGVEIVSRQGGYIFTPEPYVVMYGYRIPVYTNSIDISVIEDNLKSYIDDNMIRCIELSDFPTFDVNIFSGSVTEVALGEAALTSKTLFVYDEKAYQVSLSKETALKELVDVANEAMDIYNSVGYDQLQLSILGASHNTIIESFRLIDTFIFYLKKEDSKFGFSIEEATA